MFKNATTQTVQPVESVFVMEYIGKSGTLTFIPTLSCVYFVKVALHLVVLVSTPSMERIGSMMLCK